MLNTLSQVPWAYLQLSRHLWMLPLWTYPGQNKKSITFGGTKQEISLTHERSIFIKETLKKKKKLTGFFLKAKSLLWEYFPNWESQHDCWDERPRHLWLVDSVGFFLTSFESWILHLFIIHLYLWILWDFFSLLLNASCIFLFIFFTGAHLCPTHSYFYLTNKTKQKREKWFTCADFCPSHSYLYIFDTKKGETVTLLTCAHLCFLNASRMLFFISHLCASLPGEQLQS